MARFDDHQRHCADHAPRVAAMGSVGAGLDQARLIGCVLGAGGAGGLSKIDRLRAKLFSSWKDFRGNSSRPPGAGVLIAFLALIAFCNFIVWDVSESARKCDLDKVERQIENLDRKQDIIELKIDSLILTSRFRDQLIKDQNYWDQNEKNLKSIADTQSKIQIIEKSFEIVCNEVGIIHQEMFVLFLIVKFLFGILTVFPYRKVQRKSSKENV